MAGRSGANRGVAASVAVETFLHQDPGPAPNVAGPPQHYLPPHGTKKPLGLELVGLELGQMGTGLPGPLFERCQKTVRVALMALGSDHRHIQQVSYTAP